VCWRCCWLVDSKDIGPIEKPVLGLLIPRRSLWEQMDEARQGGTGWPGFRWKTDIKTEMAVVVVVMVVVMMLGAYNSGKPGFLEISGNLLVLENSGKTQGI